jgi:hypothetical protein
MESLELGQGLTVSAVSPSLELARVISSTEDHFQGFSGEKTNE